jgi:small subunit ribosomal protein S2
VSLYTFRRSDGTRRRGPGAVAVALTFGVSAFVVAPAALAQVHVGRADEVVTYQPPVAAPVLDPFRAPVNPYGPGNRGIEYDTWPGQPVMAAADGTVVFAGSVAGALHVTIAHADGVRTSYSFLVSIGVAVGQRVDQGTEVGRAGETFHFGARIGSVYVDPVALFGAGPTEAVLVPHDQPMSATTSRHVDQRRPGRAPDLRCVVRRGCRRAVGAGRVVRSGQATKLACRLGRRRALPSVHIPRSPRPTAGAQHGLRPTDGKETTSMAPVVTMKQLLEAGVHFGHQTRRWNPKMKRFILGERNGIYIIDLEQTLNGVAKSYAFVRDLVADGGSILFIGTKKQAQDPVATYARRCGMPYVNQRWLGGMLTNFDTISKRVGKMLEYERMRDTGEFSAMPKKEALHYTRELEKLERNLGGIRTMTRAPQAVFVLDTKKEQIAVTEANKLRVPVVAVVDTNCDPDVIQYVIPGNDDAIRAASLMCRIISDAVQEGRFIAAKKGVVAAAPMPAAPAERTPEEEARHVAEQAEARKQAAAQAREREARLARVQAEQAGEAARISAEVGTDAEVGASEATGEPAPALTAEQREEAEAIAADVEAAAASEAVVTEAAATPEAANPAEAAATSEAAGSVPATDDGADQSTVDTDEAAAADVATDVEDAAGSAEPGSAEPAAPEPAGAAPTAGRSAATESTET